jgi:hypothetical protein
VNERRKEAYRWLLYQAMLQIRPLRWIDAELVQRIDPDSYLWKRMRVSGAIADWLHNLAQFAALDFSGFDEERFWQEYGDLVGSYPDQGLERYQNEFQRITSS